MVRERRASGGGGLPPLGATNGGDHPDPPPSSRANGNGSASPGSSGSLRGSRHARVPDISDRPLKTLLPQLSVDHPEPFYVTQNIV